MRVAILDDYQDVARSMADWHGLPQGSSLTVFTRPFAGLEEAAEALAPFDVLVAMRERTPFPAVLVERLTNLRLLVTTGARNNAIDLAACTARGIVVSGTGMVGAPTAELTWGLILALAKRIPQQQQALRAGIWQTALTVDLDGKRLGLVGLGKLGAKVARIGQAFGMEVAAWSPNLTEERAAAAGVIRLDKRDLFASADVISVHLVLSDRTRGVVGEEDLGAMKPSAFFINTSRAGLVDEDALLAALRSGRIAGAGLDVFNEEPLPPASPWLDMPNTVLTPHLGYVTEENYRVFYRDALEDIVAWNSGSPIRLLTP